MSGLRTDHVASFDGTGLAVRRLGAGQPVLLLHGLFSSAEMNWIRFGHAQALADAGFEAIMPDLRAHGASDAPHQPAAYPPDVLVKDVIALIEALGLGDYDLAGFSLGARTAARSVIEGLAPRRLVLGGMGLEGISGWRRRSAVFVEAIDRFDTVRRGEQPFFAVQFMKTMKIDRVAARLLLESVEDIEPADLARITMPTLVVAGSEDRGQWIAPGTRRSAAARALRGGAGHAYEFGHGTRAGTGDRALPAGWQVIGMSATMLWYAALVMFAIVVMLGRPLKPGIAAHQRAGSAAAVDEIQRAWEQAGQRGRAIAAMAGDLVFIGTYTLGSLAMGWSMVAGNGAAEPALGRAVMVAAVLYGASDYLETVCEFVQLLGRRGSDVLARAARLSGGPKLATFLFTVFAIGGHLIAIW